MATAGETIIAGKVSGERIADNTVTADSGNITTTETQVQSVTAALVTGRKYRVAWYLHWGSTVATDRAAFRIREDNVSGTVLQEIAAGATAVHGGASLGDFLLVIAEYTAVATGNKTFSATIVRSSGTGNVILEGATTRPNYMIVEYVSG